MTWYLRVVHADEDARHWQFSVSGSMWVLAVAGRTSDLQRSPDATHWPPDPCSHWRHEVLRDWHYIAQGTWNCLAFVTEVWLMLNTLSVESLLNVCTVLVASNTICCVISARTVTLNTCMGWIQQSQFENHHLWHTYHFCITYQYFSNNQKCEIKCITLQCSYLKTGKFL